MNCLSKERGGKVYLRVATELGEVVFERAQDEGVIRVKEFHQITHAKRNEGETHSDG